MGIQTITTPAGEEMVVMPRAEYEALIAASEEAFEDGADVAAYTAALAAASPEEVLPADVTAAILQGKGRIRAFREWRGLNQQDLAEASSLSLDHVIQIESGQTLLSRDTAARIALALNLPTGWLTV